jgi:hypothetical protein
MVRIGRAIVGLIGGTMMAFALLIFCYVALVGLFDMRDGDFGLGFGLVIAPLASLVVGIGMAVFMALSTWIRRADVFLIVALVTSILTYIAATAID